MAYTMYAVSACTCSLRICAFSCLHVYHHQGDGVRAEASSVHLVEVPFGQIRRPDEDQSAECVPQARVGRSNGPYLDSFPLPCHCQGGGRGG